MNSTIIDKTKSYVKEIFAKEVPKEFEYHNYYHTNKVVEALNTLSQKAAITDEQKEVLILAAYFHDLGFSINPENHEEHSKKLAQEFLKDNDYPYERIAEVLKCIEATKMAWKGEDKLCCMIKDADLSGLASLDYDNHSENLRRELSFRERKNIDKESWIKKNIEFLQNHTYITEEAKELFSEGKEVNLQKLKKLEKQIKKLKQHTNLSIAKSKSAQTQFKTALRNHIDLSSIADNKANIMLSVNAVVITVGLPLLLERATDIPQLYVPTIILSLVCLISMIFATLATRPIQMKGDFNLEDIKLKKTNLFFFGNYYKMNIEKYEKAVQEVVADDELLDNSIIRDLFFLGKSLGNKFDYLRWCYNFFMYGIILAVLACVISFMVY